MDNCPVCGENSVTEDTENGRTVRVCTECGAMDNDMHELTSDDRFEGTSLSDGKAYGPRAKGTKNWMKLGSTASERHKLAGKNLITNIGNQLKVGEHIIDEACHLYEKVFDTELYNTLSDTKKAMCLACLYSSARMAHISINIRELSFFLNIEKSAKRFGAALKTLKHNHNVHLPPLDIENEAFRILSQSDLDKDIVKMGNQIIQMMQRLMVTSGRCCTSYAVPCAYYAFKASDISKYRKLTFKAFCKMFKFKLTNKYSCRSEIEEALKAMAKELPWLKGSGVKIDHVEVHLKDIIKYQTSLFVQTVLTAVNELEETDKQITEVDEELLLDSVTTFRKFPKRKHVEETSENDIDTPVEKKKKVGKSREKQMNDDSSDIENFDLGSDDDTDQYILTPKEVKKKQKMNIFLGCLDEDKHTDNVVEETSKSVETVKEESNGAGGFVTGERKDVDNDDDKVKTYKDVKVEDGNDVNDGVHDKSDDNDDDSCDNSDYNNGDIDDTGEVEGASNFNHLLSRLTNKPEGYEEVAGSCSDEEFYD
ncbi:transcription factor IIIB 50 kDa subunit-like [Ruditapes philippinarum]|uniref:transcription factor IIIB 50 kDa subunit-like n=1 Tax=Ruditapes philippinarum TaxID=129788 RepID=UPI00295BD9A7|nr:transcription factor IIIB 50 kDa subunit-like [Ruditapes philippinarum]